MNSLAKIGVLKSYTTAKSRFSAFWLRRQSAKELPFIEARNMLGLFPLVH
jgi:hypothetical protein